MKVGIRRERQARDRLLHACIAAILAAAAGSSTAESWEIETVQPPKFLFRPTDRALGYDELGHPHVAYGGDHLYYAWFDGTDWLSETVDDSPAVGAYASLSLDGTGDPHISYYDEENDRLKYAFRDEVGWHIESVNNPGEGGLWTSLALDGDGNPRVTFRAGDYSAWRLFYAYKDQSGWHFETVEGVHSTLTGGSTSLALDAYGVPHVSYYIVLPSTGIVLRHAYLHEDTWLKQIVDTSMYDAPTSLALDGQGHPHISYYRYVMISSPPPEVAHLMYAYFDGEVWHTEKADSVGLLSSGPWQDWTSIALDAEEKPHISFTDRAPTSGLCYARKSNSKWTIEYVADAELINGYTSIVMDETDTPRVIFSGGQPEDYLMFASRAGDSWQSEVIDSSATHGSHTALALDPQGYPHISLYDLGNEDLLYTYEDEIGWHTEVVDSVGNVGTYASITLDSSGRPHISYHGNDHLKYAYRGESGWSVETVDDYFVYVGRHTSITVDDGGSAHISYYGNYVLKYACQTQYGWRTYFIDEGPGTSGLFTSLALDSAGYPHISYRKSDDVGYAMPILPAGILKLPCQTPGSMRTHRWPLMRMMILISAIATTTHRWVIRTKAFLVGWLRLLTTPST